MVKSQPRISPVLHDKLGENGAAALAETLEAYMRQHARELEDAAWQRVDKRLDRVDETMEKLAEAQQRTEARIASLVKAHARAEERAGRLEAALDRLAEAQARTEERVARLERAV